MQVAVDHELRLVVPELTDGRQGGTYDPWFGEDEICSPLAQVAFPFFDAVAQARQVPRLRRRGQPLVELRGDAHDLVARPRLGERCRARALEQHRKVLICAFVQAHGAVTV